MIQKLVQEIENTYKQMQDGVHTAIPGKLSAYDPSTNSVTASPDGIVKTPSGESKTYPVVGKAPVAMPFGIGVPIEDGAGGLVVFSEQSIEELKGNKRLDLKFDLTDAIALPNLIYGIHEAMKMAHEKQAIVLLKEGTFIRVMDGLIEVESEQIDIKGDVSITGNVKTLGNVDIQGDVTLTGAVKITGNVEIIGNLKVTGAIDN